MFAYRQASGAFEDAIGSILDMGYSGQPPHKNLPESEDLVGKGPCPRGSYKAKELREHTDTHGPYVIVLEPDADTRARILAMGRNPDTFYVHGDSIKNPGFASEGCLIVKLAARQAFWQSGDMLEVTA